MTAAELAALYEAAEDCTDKALLLAVVRALRDENFAAQVRVWLDAPPEARRALAGMLRGPVGAPSANTQ